MVLIRFVERSLLYGYSHMWVVFQLAFPSLWWPNLSDTKNRYFLDDFPQVRQYFESNPRWAWLKRFSKQVWFVILLIRQLQIGYHLTYLTLLIFLNLETQKQILVQYDITSESELSYKALFYAPILQRCGLLLVTLIWVIVVKPKDWLIYDKYRIFSLGYKTQLRYFLLLILIGIPDGIIDHFYITSYLAQADKSRYKLVRYAHIPTFSSNILTFLLRLILILLNAMGNSFRYQPLLNIIYSATCVRRHLRVINNQLALSHKDRNEIFAGKEAGGAGDGFNGGRGSEQMSESSSQLHKNFSQFGSSPDLIKSSKDPGRSTRAASFIGAQISNPLSRWPQDSWTTEKTLHEDVTDIANNMEPSSNLSESDSFQNRSSIYKRPNKSGTYSKSNDTDPETGTSSPSSGSVMSTDNLIPSKRLELNSNSINRSTLIDKKNQSNQAASKAGVEMDDSQQICVIKNLGHLELHLTKLDFFVGDMDRSAAPVVFTMCLLSFLQFIYSLFFILEVGRTFVNIAHGMVYCASRLVLPFVLFIMGNSMEAEAKRMLVELDIIYLQDSSRRLIYKQYGSTMVSLSRIAKLLKSTRFTCDNLLGLNLDTMKKFFFYTVAAMFVVIQYDALNVLYEKTDLSSNSSETALTAPVGSQ